MIYIAFLLFTFFILFFAFYQWQFFMVFSPIYHRGEKMCAACSLLSITTKDNVELEGALYEPLEPKATLLVFVGRSHDAVGIINKLAESYSDLRIVTFNYRSYGRSGGKLSEQNLLSDAMLIATLVQKNYGNFSLLGYSLGSNVAAYVAMNHKVQKLFLVGAFDSIASLAKSKFVDKSFFPMIDLSRVFRYKFPTQEYVQNIDAPTYLFSSLDDELTYIANARRLKEKIKNLRAYKELQGLNHKELLWDDEVIKEIHRETID
jgi:pimeloyl-ACP methyl ester carboxylesterase